MPPKALLFPVMARNCAATNELRLSTEFKFPVMTVAVDCVFWSERVREPFTSLDGAAGGGGIDAGDGLAGAVDVEHAAGEAETGGGGESAEDIGDGNGTNARPTAENAGLRVPPVIWVSPVWAFVLVPTSLQRWLPDLMRVAAPGCRH